MGLSGMFNVGHDIGGFAGPVPDAELLVRWIQACALNPRCIMNSWKEDGSVNTPWLHPEVTGVIRAAIELRLSLVPYLYTCLYDAVEHARPVLRPTFWEFPGDAQCWDDSDEMLVGPDLLVAPVLAPGATTRTLYLPQDAATPGWRCYHTGAWYRSGTTITVDAPLDHLPLFVRAGAVIPTTDAADGGRRTDEPSRALRVYPAAPDVDRGARTSHWIEDDGVTARWKDGALARVRCALTSDAGALRLLLTREGAFPLPCDRVRVVLPPGETRDFAVESESLGVPVAR